MNSSGKCKTNLYSPNKALAAEGSLFVFYKTMVASQDFRLSAVRPQAAGRPAPFNTKHKALNTTLQTKHLLHSRPAQITSESQDFRLSAAGPHPTRNQKINTQHETQNTKHTTDNKQHTKV